MADAGVPAARVDTLVYRGTDTNDTFGVATSGDVTLNSQVVVTTPGVAILTLLGLTGSDQFQVTGYTPAVVGPPAVPAVTNPFTTINVHGGDPDDADTLTAISPAAAPVVNFGTAQVTGYGATINYTGLATINADAGAARV